MARGRMLDNDYWENEGVTCKLAWKRLLWAYLFTKGADDEARGRAAPRTLAGAVFPYEDITPEQVSNALKEFEVEGRLFLYEGDQGQRYYQIPPENWKRYQRIRHPQPSKLPPPPTDWRHKLKARIACARDDGGNAAKVPTKSRRILRPIKLTKIINKKIDLQKTEDLLSEEEDRLICGKPVENSEREIEIPLSSFHKAKVELNNPLPILWPRLCINSLFLIIVSNNVWIFYADGVKDFPA